MIIVFWPCRRTHELDRYAGIARNPSGLMKAVYDVAPITKVAELHCCWVIDKREDLGFNPQLRIRARCGHTGTQTFTRFDFARNVHPVQTRR